MSNYQDFRILLVKNLNLKEIMYSIVFHQMTMSEPTPTPPSTSTPTPTPTVTPNRIKQMEDIQHQALEMFRRKNADYGDAFAKFGVIGVLMRIEDKIQRALSISKSQIQLVKDEKIEDTLLDLHNYAAMALMLLGEEN